VCLAPGDDTKKQCTYIRTYMYIYIHTCTHNVCNTYVYWIGLVMCVCVCVCEGRLQEVMQQRVRADKEISN